MINLIRGEFYKLRKSKYFIGMITLAFAFGFLLMIFWDHEREMNRSYEGAILNGAYVLTDGDGFGDIMLGNFLFALLASGFIVKDFKSSNITKSFVYGYKRTQVLLSKILVTMLFSLLLEIIYISVLVSYVSLIHGFCDSLNLDTILALVRTIILGIMYNLATISIIFMTAIITKSNFCTIVAPFALIILFCYAFPYSKYPYVSYILSYLPYIAGIHAMVRFASLFEIIKCIVSSIITFIITIGGSILFVKYEDIK